MTLATSLLSTSQQIGEYGEGGNRAGGLEVRGVCTELFSVQIIVNNIQHHVEQ